MLYYRVKKECDNITRYKENAKHTIISDGILIGNELYTQKERDKILNSNKCFEKVNINKNNTYFFFGARFSE